MKLYTFGYNHHHEPSAAYTSTKSDHLAHTCIVTAETIQVLWASWCDVVIAYENSPGSWKVEYRGVCLTHAQQEHIAHSAPILKAIGRHQATVQFFGSTLHEGLRGYLIKSLDGTDSEICILSTDLEVEAGVPLIRTFVSANAPKISMIQMESSGNILVISGCDSNETQIMRFDNLNEFAAHLDAQPSSSSHTQQTAPFTAVQSCTNATTGTALSSSGQIFTSSRDPRFSKCLGRTSGKSSMFETIPYFSETCIQAISSGGYVSGAVSTEGELFLWGQASIPGYEGSISVLGDAVPEEGGHKRGAGTKATCAPDQDDMIKCLNVYINGEEARTQKVAIGHGHVLVAAEVHGTDGVTKRALLAAGVNSNGQLGLHTSTKFIKNFEEISVFRDMAIYQLVATGWSTYVVVLFGHA